MGKLIVVSDILEKSNIIFLCTTCSKPLSYPPIYSYKNENICGRCIDTCLVSPDGRQKYVRNEIYELLAQEINFSCKFYLNGCGNQHLAMKDVPDHEKFCMYRPVSCPITAVECSWNGPFSKLIAHCDAEHSFFILKKAEKFEFESKLSHKTTYVYVYKDNLFIVTWTVDSEKNKVNFMIKNVREDIQDIYYCIVMLEFECQSFIKKTTTNVSTDIVYLPLVENHLEKDVISSLYINAYLCISNKPIESNFMKEPSYIQTRKLLKCSECDRLAYPPIHKTQPDMLIVCSRCAPKRKEYNRLFEDLHLTNIANLFKYECDNRSSGCRILGSASFMQKHQEECLYNPVECCILVQIKQKREKKCPWKGNRLALVKHLEKDHSKSKFDHYSLQKLEKIESNVVKFTFWNDYCFKFLITTNNHNLCFDVQKIDAFLEEFEFSIELINEQIDKNNLILEQRCSHFTKGLSQDYCTLFSDLVKLDFYTSFRLGIRIANI